MRTPTRLTTTLTVAALGVTGVAAVAAAQGPSGTGGQGNGRGQATNGTCRATNGTCPAGTPQQQRRQRRQPAARQRAAGRRGAQNRGRAQRGACTRALPATSATPMTADEQAAVAYMREEEKLARDVYTALAKQYDNPVFTRIATSEQRHMDAIAVLLARYGVADPVAGKAAGAFADAKLQGLYDALVAEGGVNAAAALAVGQKIEKLDIADLKAGLAATKKADVTLVFTNLLRGSNNHLRAFTAAAGAVS